MANELSKQFNNHIHTCKLYIDRYHKLPTANDVRYQNIGTWLDKKRKDLTNKTLNSREGFEICKLYAYLTRVRDISDIKTKETKK